MVTKVHIFSPFSPLAYVPIMCNLSAVRLCRRLQSSTQYQPYKLYSYDN